MVSTISGAILGGQQYSNKNTSIQNQKAVIKIKFNPTLN